MLSNCVAVVKKTTLLNKVEQQNRTKTSTNAMDTLATIAICLIVSERLTRNGVLH